MPKPEENLKLETHKFVLTTCIKVLYYSTTLKRFIKSNFFFVNTKYKYIYYINNIVNLFVIVFYNFIV